MEEKRKEDEGGGDSALASQTFISSHSINKFHSHFFGARSAYTTALPRGNNYRGADTPQHTASTKSAALV